MIGSPAGRGAVSSPARAACACACRLAALADGTAISATSAAATMAYVAGVHPAVVERGAMRRDAMRVPLRLVSALDKSPRIGVDPPKRRNGADGSPSGRRSRSPSQTARSSPRGCLAIGKRADIGYSRFDALMTLDV